MSQSSAQSSLHASTPPEAASAPPSETRSALQRLLAVTVTVAALSLSTYALPGLARFRPWIPGEPVPLSRLFGGAQADGSGDAPTLPEFAEAGSAIGSSHTAADGVLGQHVTANLTRPRRASPAPTRQSEASRAEASGGHAEPPVHIAPEEYAGLAASIEDPSGHAIDAFYAALKATAQGKPGAITRVAHYGDSAVAADGVTATMRRNLQQRFGDAGHGFVLVARGDMHYVHRDVRHRASDDWNIYPVMRRQLGEDWYGYGGVQFRARRGPHASFDTVDDAPVGNRVSRYEIFYQRHRRGGQLRVRVDDEWLEPISTRSETQEDAWKTIRVPDGPHRLVLQSGGRGELRIYGVALERDVPGVVYDSLGLVGARAKRLLNADAAHMGRQVSHRKPNLLVLAFGGNSVDDPFIDVETYKAQYAQVLHNMRSGRRDLPCLLFAPLDQGERNERGRVVTIPNVPLLVQAQREVAAAAGCAFFDTFQAMGGERAMWSWYRHRPRLATGDFRHATPAGYDVLGNMFYKALLEGFAAYLDRSASR